MFNEFNPENIEDRIELLKYINSESNKERKKKSIKEHEIFKNNLSKHVEKRLISYNSKVSVDKMAKVEDIGLCKQIITNEASIYIEPPKREFTGTKKKKIKSSLNELYSLLQIDNINKKQNRFLKLQRQNVSYIVANSRQELEKKVLKLHEFDVVPNLSDPSNPFGFVISNYYQPEKKEKQRYVIWTEKFNFTMDGNARYVEQNPIDRLNPIAPMLPFNDCFYDKDGDFFTDENELSVNFGININAAFSELYHIMRMQGFGQAVMTGSKKGLPTAEELTVGVSNIIVLLTEEGETADFKFVNASPDLAGSIEVIATLISAFLTSKGVDPKKLSIKGDSPTTFSSGFERFLALIEEFKATLDDMEIMRNAEKRDFEIIKSWLEAYKGTNYLKDEYQIGEDLKSIKLKIEFQKPHAVETKAERNSRLKGEVDNGFKSKLDAIREYYGLETIEEALEKYKEMVEHDRLMIEATPIKKEEVKDESN
tara:strand:+ start:1523 stop:2968 length:1446 start_codon:yes stop_codon:yes gene_type:complete